MERCASSRAQRLSALAGPSSSLADTDPSESASSRDGDEHVCPWCYSSCFELSALIKHVNDEHAFQQRSTRCPVCSKSVKDLLSHLLVHQRNAEERFCSSSSSQASSSLSSAMSSDWARAAKQEEELLLKMKAASLSGSPCLPRQESLTDKHGRLKQAHERPAQHTLLHEASDTAKQKQSLISEPPVIPPVVDTPEMRARYIRELLLTAFEIDGAYS